MFDNNVDGNSVVIGLEIKICHLHLASTMLISAVSWAQLVDHFVKTLLKIIIKQIKTNKINWFIF